MKLCLLDTHPIRDIFFHYRDKEFRYPVTAPNLDIFINSVLILTHFARFYIILDLF